MLPVRWAWLLQLLVCCSLSGSDASLPRHLKINTFALTFFFFLCNSFCKYSLLKNTFFPQTSFLNSFFCFFSPTVFLLLPRTFLNCDYFLGPLHSLLLLFLHPQPACVCALDRLASRRASRQRGSGVFWLPAKLMSKCHPHATVIQISYFLPFLVQTSHPSRLSPSFTPSRQAPSFSFFCLLS